MTGPMMIGPKATQEQILIGLAKQVALFHDRGGTAYADLKIGGHRETWAIRDATFKQWLMHGYYRLKGGAPNAEAMRSVLATIEAKARYDGPERSVHIRIATHGSKLYLDLADKQWRSVEIGTNGWQIVTDPPVRFRRAPGMLPLPDPVRGGSIQALQPFLNVAKVNDFALAVAWLLAALRDHGPYPVLVLSAEQGSAKSTAARLLRAIVDPNSAPLRSLPREERDLYVAANNGHVLAFDNLSWLPQSSSDSLCRIATGGAFATRQLYTDSDETLFEAVKPIILAGIEDVVVRGDLADRSIFLRLEPIPEHQRRPEAELHRDFEISSPGIFGALLDALAAGLLNLPNVRPAQLPRMADFAIWVAACEPALWSNGTFERAYALARADAAETVIEADALATGLRSFIAARLKWTGTATQLLQSLKAFQTNDRTWPRNPRALSGRLRRAAPNLRLIGIETVFGNRVGHGRDRMISVCVAGPGSAGLQPSAPSAIGENIAESK
jgi:hypothetical protein